MLVLPNLVKECLRLGSTLTIGTAFPFDKHYRWELKLLGVAVFVVRWRQLAVSIAIRFVNQKYVDLAIVQAFEVRPAALPSGRRLILKQDRLAMLHEEWVGCDQRRDCHAFDFQLLLNRANEDSDFAHIVEAFMMASAPAW